MLRITRGVVFIAASAIIASMSTVASAGRSRDEVIRIGFVTDFSGPFEPVDGHAGAQAMRMAIEEVSGRAAGRRIELILGDHRNDVSVATALAQEWTAKQRVDVIIGGVNSDTSLAIATVVHAAKNLMLVVGAGTTEHTREQCSAFVVQYAYDTYSHGRALASVLARNGNKRWHLVTAEYPFGVQLEQATALTVSELGGSIVGTVRHPHGATEFAPIFDAALRSGADVVSLSNTHSEVVAAVKAARALHIQSRLQLAATFVSIDDIHEIGLEQAQGMYVTDSWYWSRDDETRRWSRAFFERTGRMPSSLQAADYSAVKQYLLAVDQSRSTEPARVLSQMKSHALSDVYTHSAQLRGDGRLIHDMYVLQIKRPDQSTEAWDYYQPVATVSGSYASLPETPCGVRM